MESTPSATGAGHGGASVLMLAMPGAQGHVNPMLQFGRRLAYHGLRPTLVTTRYLLSTTPPPGDPFRVAAISDGFDAGGSASCPDIAVYIARLAVVGGETLAELLASEAREGRPARVLVYDPHLSWAPKVARAAGVPTAAFFSQPCSVNIIYGELWAGRLALPVTDGRELLKRGALGVELGPEDVPPFVAVPELSPGLRKTSVGQFEGLEEADDVLVNSFCDVEPEEAKYMESTWRAKMIGPTLPSFYLDDHRLPSNKSYGFNFFGGDDSCMEWMDKQSNNSVVLVSYGTFSQYDPAQLEELGNGLCNSGKPFIWVVRSKESDKLSEELKAKCKDKGIIVSWCPQLAVLSHKAIGHARPSPSVDPALVSVMLRRGRRMGLAVCRTWAFTDGGGPGALLFSPVQQAAAQALLLAAAAYAYAKQGAGPLRPAWTTSRAPSRPSPSSRCGRRRRGPRRGWI